MIRFLESEWAVKIMEADKFLVFENKTQDEAETSRVRRIISLVRRIFSPVMLIVLNCFQNFLKLLKLD